MELLFNFLEKWQTLIGSFIGGIVGLLAALLVAYKERRRDENSSARLLISDFVVFKEAVASAEKNIPLETREDKRLLEITRNLVKLRPGVSPMFDSSMVRVMSVDNRLDAHLTLFKSKYSYIT